MTSNKQFEELSEKLDMLIKLTAMNALRERTLTDQVEILSAIGLEPKEIATILGSDPATISTLKSRAKKKRTKKAKSKEEVQER